MYTNFTVLSFDKESLLLKNPRASAMEICLVNADRVLHQ